MPQLLIAVWLVAQHFASPVMAGNGSVQAGGAAVLPAEQIAVFSKRIEEKLASHGARVALLARSGRPKEELPAQIEYTHVAFAVYSMIEMRDGSRQPGYAIYNLYQNAERRDHSSLVQDYAFDFFAGVPELRAGFIIPVPAVQKRLLSTITSGQYLDLHNPNYSVIANPDNSKRQNCTEFVLDVLNSSIYETTDTNYIKRVVRDHFVAQSVEVSRFKLATGAMLSKELTLEDQGHVVKTATFSSIARYMQKFNLVAELIHVDESSLK